MFIEPFEGPLLKLRRARHHLEDMQALMEAYMARSPIYRNVRPDPDNPGWLIGEIIIEEAPPSDFATIMGDAIHNMRVALDLLANDLVRIEGGDTEKVYFPFAKSSTELEKTIKLRNLLQAAPEAVDLIRKLAPYPGGNDRLRGLHELDIQDKHQMIIPAIGYIRYATGGIGVYALSVKTGAFGQSHYRAEVDVEEALLVGKKLPVTFDLKFPFMGPFDSKSVITTLTDLAQYLFGVLQSFAALYGRQLTE